MTFGLVAKNSAQKIASVGLNGNEGIFVGGVPIVIYTCPAGKKAVVAGTMTAISLGSGGNVHMNYATRAVITVTATNITSNTITHTINAGETVALEQNAPAGGNADWKLTVTESPV